MDMVLHEGVKQYKTYLDRICSLCPQKGWPKHLSVLREVFFRYQNYNITLKIKKCEYGVKTKHH